MTQTLQGRMTATRSTVPPSALGSPMTVPHDDRSAPMPHDCLPGLTGLGVDPRMVDELVDACASRVIAADYDSAAFRTFVATRADVTRPDALLTVLTLVARRLGDMWLADDCTFNDVTIGMHRLTLLLIALEPPTGDPQAEPQHGGRIFVAPAPGDQHGFGLAMVGFFLRRAGWDVSAELGGDARDIVDRVAARDYDCIGFSVGHERAIAPVAALIAEVRRRSRRRSVTIVVGGPMIVADPTLADRMAADVWADDAATLVDRLRPFVPTRAV